MDCEKIQEFISLYVDGELEQDKICELENHIESCESCKNEFNQILDIVDSLKSLPQLELPDDFHNELMDKIKANTDAKSIEIKKPKFKIFANKKWKMVSALAAACCAFIIFSTVLNNFNDLNTNTAPSLPRAASQNYNSSSYTQSETGSNEMVAEGEQISEDIAEKNAASEQLRGYEEQNESKKIIKRAEISLEVDNFENTINSLKQLTEDLGGYIENTNSYITYNNNNNQLKAGNITLRVPSEQYDFVLDSTKNLGNVISTNEYGEDITSRYIDTESILKTKRLEEQRLLAIMEQTNTVEDLILVEQRLSDVRGEIETYTARINNWDRLVDFCTITVNIEQINKNSDLSTSNFTFQIHQSFFNSIDNIKEGAKQLAIWLAQILPLFIIFWSFILVIFIIYLIIKRIIKNPHFKKHH